MQKGFNLIELLIAMVIIAILSLLIYPSYNSYFIRAHRNLGIIALSDASGRIEEYYTRHNSYAGATPSNLKLNNAAINGYYIMSITAKNNTYTLSAIPQGKQAAKDAGCGTLMIDQFGNKSVSGKLATNECWNN